MWNISIIMSDENHEILHKYIYKLLAKYNMPLFNEQLELNKKQKIISYNLNFYYLYTI